MCVLMLCRVVATRLNVWNVEAKDETACVCVCVGRKGGALHCCGEEKGAPANGACRLCRLCAAWHGQTVRQCGPCSAVLAGPRLCPVTHAFRSCPASLRLAGGFHLHAQGAWRHTPQPPPRPRHRALDHHAQTLQTSGIKTSTAGSLPADRQHRQSNPAVLRCAAGIRSTPLPPRPPPPPLANRPAGRTTAGQGGERRRRRRCRPAP